MHHRLLHRRGLLVACAVAFFLLPARHLHADSDNRSFNATRFLPAGGTYDILTIHSARVAPAGRMTFFVMGNYADKVLRLLSNTTGKELNVLRNQLAFDLGGAIGLWNRFEVSVVLPAVAYQTGEPAPFTSSKLANGPPRSGFADMRITPRLHVMSYGEYDLGLIVPVTLPTGRSDAYMSYRAVTALPQLASEYTTPIGLRFLANIGFALRPERLYMQAKIGNAALFGFGADWLFTWKDQAFRLESSVQGEWVLGNTTSVGLPIGFLVGAAWQIHPTIAWTLGVGKGLTNGYGEPLARAVAGLSYSPILGTPPPPPPRPAPPAPPPAPPPDTDGDGILDADDLCPTVPKGPVPDPNRRGCPDPDADGDGVTDSTDICPVVAAGTYPDPARAGCPDLDTDSDGVRDSQDKCPSLASGLHPDPDRAGCPVPDRDNDQVSDAKDACPDTPGAPHRDPAKNGCPGKIIIRGYQIVILEPVLFATGTATLLPGSFPVLDAIAEALEAVPEITRLSIEGHTDSQGKPEKNMVLSENRAKSCVDWLTSQGIAAGRLESHGYGLTKPVATNETAEGRARNRRVDFQVIGVANVPVNAVVQVNEHEAPAPVPSAAPPSAPPHAP